MKVIEEWEDGEYKVTIKAEFVTNGTNIGSWVDVRLDAVFFVAEIQLKNEDWLTIGDEAHSRKYYESRFLRPKKYVESLEESYIMTLKDLKLRVRNNIDAHRLKTQIKITDQNITDGLPDSLKGM